MTMAILIFADIRLVNSLLENIQRTGILPWRGTGAQVPCLQTEAPWYARASPRGGAMLPTLFRIGPLEIGTHDAFVALGALCAAYVYLREAERRDALEERTVWIAVGALLCGALAAKASTVWRYVAFAPEPSVVGAILYGGKSILG